MITACEVDLNFRAKMVSLLRRRWTSAVNVLSSALFIVESIKSYLKSEETSWMLNKLLHSKSRILESKYQKRILVAFLETHPSATSINRVWEEVILPYGLPSSLDDKCLTTMLIKLIQHDHLSASKELVWCLERSLRSLIGRNFFNFMWSKISDN